MKSKLIVVLTFALIILLATSCAQTETPTQVPLPTAAPTDRPANTPTEAPSATPTDEPTEIPTPTLTETPEPTPTVTPIFVDIETFETLKAVQVPVNNPDELAQRLKGVGELYPIEPPAAPLEVGAKDAFWVTDYTDESYEVPATLHYVTDHAYFWVADDALFEMADLERLANTFENKIYTTDRSFFGSEWSPGIDGDEHIYILFARRLGLYVAGYFSTADEMHPSAHEFSNAHEMFVLNIDNVEMADEYTYGTLAHEFQHMIHWNLDRNETTWLNEGFSELAQFLNGYPTGSFDQQYTQNPDHQLNTWSGDDDLNNLHYGASFLFTAYLLDRLGKEATQALAAHPANGLSSIDIILEDMGITNPSTGETLTADDLVMDWVITNFVNDETIGDGQYVYIKYASPPCTRQSEVIRNCESGPQAFDVHQYGVDYIRILCPGQFNLRFDGAVETKLVPADPYSGEYAFWSNKGDSSDMTLTQTFDFTDQSGPITLNYWTWYDIEKGYDYLYLEASIDGESWEILQTPSGTDRDPSGNSYGWGYTSGSRGDEWIQETIDLSAYAGQQVQLRFEYITDAALHGEGFLLDNIEIPEIGYFSDFEGDDGGWQAEGWVRVKNGLPQSFRLALITTSGDIVTVEPIPLGVNNLVDIQLDIPEEGKSIVLVVLGTSRFTRELANYTLDFTQK
jgi:immune inhibitor A